MKCFRLSLLLFFTLSTLPASDEPDHAALDQPTLHIQGADEASMQNAPIEMSEEERQLLAQFIYYLQLYAGQHNVTLEQQDFFDTVEWKAFAKKHNIQKTAAEFCAELFDAKSNGQDWMQFCQQNNINPGYLIDELQKNKRASSGKIQPIHILQLIECIGQEGIRSFFSHKLELAILSELEEPHRQAYLDRKRAVQKGIVTKGFLKSLEYLPKGAKIILDIKNLESKHFKVGQIPVVERNNFIMDVICGSAHDIGKYELDNAEYDRSNGLDTFRAFLSPEQTIPIRKTSPTNRVEHLQDAAILFGSNLLTHISSNTGEYILDNLDEQVYLSCKNGTFRLLTKRNLAKATQNTAEQVALTCLLSQLSSNKRKDAADTSKLPSIPSAKKVSALYLINAANEVIYSFIAQAAHSYSAGFLPEDGQPKNNVQESVKSGIQQFLATSVIVPGCILVGKGAKWLGEELAYRCVGSILPS